MLNCGIVGLGWWGQVLARSITSSSKIKVVKGFTRTPSNAAEFIEETKLEMCASYEAMLQEKSIEAVILATPHSMHLEQIKLAANAGKHIFVE